MIQALVFFFVIERLTSRPCKQYFGQYRNHYCGNETAKTAFSFVVRSALSLDFQFNLSVFFTISKRDNFGGCHLNFQFKKSNIFYKQNIKSTFSENDIRSIAKNVFLNGTKRSTPLDEKTQRYIFIQMFPSLSHNRFSRAKSSGNFPKIIATKKP